MPEPMRAHSRAMGWKMYQEVRGCISDERTFEGWRLPASTTLCRGGRTTAASRAMTEALAQANPHAAVVVLEDLAHMAPLTSPEPVHAGDRSAPRARRGLVNAKAAKKERSHAAIVLAAARLLRERGIAGARVADVMGAAGLTVGGFYAHFASKEALVDDALRRTGRASAREALFGGLEGEPHPGRPRGGGGEALPLGGPPRPGGGRLPPSCRGLRGIATTASAHREVLAEELEVLRGRARGGDAGGGRARASAAGPRRARNHGRRALARARGAGHAALGRGSPPREPGLRRARPHRTLTRTLAKATPPRLSRSTAWRWTSPGDEGAVQRFSVKDSRSSPRPVRSSSNAPPVENHDTRIDSRRGSTRCEATSSAT